MVQFSLEGGTLTKKALRSKSVKYSFWQKLFYDIGTKKALRSKSALCKIFLVAKTDFLLAPSGALVFIMGYYSCPSLVVQ